MSSAPITPDRSSTGSATPGVADGHLAKRQLRKGAAGWVLLAGLGVSYVVSGDYSGWDFGLGQGGFGGLLIAGVLIAAMYTAMVLGMAELSSALPTAGGGYTDSLGLYFTFDARRGRRDSERNCLSNIRPPHGTGYAAAATTCAMLMAEARRLGVSGVSLKADASLTP